MFTVGENEFKWIYWFIFIKGIRDDILVMLSILHINNMSTSKAA